MHAVASEVLAKLKRFDTPTICNLIELFEVRSQSMGFMDARIRACFPEMPPLVGFASTATFRSAVPPRAGDAYTSLDGQVARFAELSGPPIVVFQDLDDPPVGATFGEVMCTIYRAFGAVGLITSGAGRDLDQVRALDFPVFTTGTICSHSYPQVIDVHLPVHVGGMAIFPDDLLHGDLNGVTTIPVEIVSELADAAEEFVAAEAVVLEAMHNEPGSIGRLRAARAESRARIDQLRDRFSRRHERG